MIIYNRNKLINMSSKPLVLEDSLRGTVNVQPSVIFTILDHYIRRNEEQNRVIGIYIWNYNNVIQIHI